MRQTPNLRIPGPTPVPADVLEAVARPMVDHRGREFAALIQRVAERLKEFYLTKEDVLLLSASGTRGLEGSVVNTHNETSTGVTNPLEEIARVVRETDRLLLVDAVSSLGAIPLDTDGWGLDAVGAGPAKRWTGAPR